MFKGKKHCWRSIVAVPLLVLALLVPTATRPVQAQGNPNPGVVPVNQQYVKLAAEWWQWVFSLPASQHPLFDETGASACLGEQPSGNLFFLAGVFNVSGTATRNVTVPAGTRLFFPVINAWWDNVGVDPPLTAAELYANAAALIDPVTELHASIDGQPVQNLFGYRAKSKPFCYTMPAADNLYQLWGYGDALAPFACPAGYCVCPAVADGYWLLLTPLPVGQHTINFGGGNGSFTLDITYHITVVPPGHYQSCL